MQRTRAAALYASSCSARLTRRLSERPTQHPQGGVCGSTTCTWAGRGCVIADMASEVPKVASGRVGGEQLSVALDRSGRGRCGVVTYSPAANALPSAVPHILFCFVDQLCMYARDGAPKTTVKA